MRRLFLTAVAVFTAVVFLVPGISSAIPPTTATVADYPAGAVANGIMLSRHNLGGFGRVLKTSATTQVCVFCHTPHHSNTGANPLWNRSLANSINYIGYGTTIAGTTVNQADLGGSTLACLSCHDGATTFDSLVNAPGQGGVVPGGDTTKNWSFEMPSYGFQNVSFDHFGNDTTPNVICNGCHGSFPGFATSDTVQRLSLGFDLSNDHPVSVPYSASSKASLRPKSTVIALINLSAGLSTGVGGETAAYLTNNLSQNRWAVSGFISSTATIGSLLRNNKVECSSCHDPHFRNLSYDEVDSTYLYANKSPAPAVPQQWCNGENCSDGFFLRRVGGNTGSGVCRTCHDK